MQRTHLLSRTTGLLVIGVAVCLAHCSATTTQKHGELGGGGGSGSGGTGGGLNIGSSLLGDGGSGGQAACGADTYAAHRVPLDILVLLDRSASMANIIADGNDTTKWAAMQQALSESLTRAGQDVNAALTLFPADNGAPRFCSTPDACNGPKGQVWGPCDVPRACDDGSTHFQSCISASTCLAGAPCNSVGLCGDGLQQCFLGKDGQCTGSGTCNPRPFECSHRFCDPIDYQTPVSAMTDAVSAASAMTATMGKLTPQGITPLGPAVKGALTWASDWAKAHPERVTTLLLATDGTPTEWTCDPSNMDDIAALIQQAAQGTPPVWTKVLGVFTPAEQANAQAGLDKLARAGGGDSAYVVSVASPTELANQIAAALDSIRIALLPCQVKIPDADPGVDIEYNLLNLVYRGPTGPAETIPYVKSADACGDAAGWHYDVDYKTGVTPKALVACPATCTKVRSSDVGAMSVEIGCPTVIR